MSPLGRVGGECEAVVAETVVGLWQEIGVRGVCLLLEEGDGMESRGMQGAEAVGALLSAGEALGDPWCR